MIRALYRWHLRRLIAAGEAHIKHAEAQIVANRADVAALRVRLALLKAPTTDRAKSVALAILVGISGGLVLAAFFGG